MCPTSDLCVNDDVYLQCVAEINRDLITTTAAISALASFLMGLLANLPVGMAPGLGLNAYVRSQLFNFSHLTDRCFFGGDFIVHLFDRRLSRFWYHLIP